jgi:Zn-dependent protease/predicted transcriptional regulator
MLGGGIPIGKAFGISLRLHYSWFFIFALVTWALAASYFPSAYPSWSLSLKIGAGILTSFLFFASVMAHELMHSLVAKSEGIPIRSITLFILGGVSEITEEPKLPKDEFKMAIAGPLTSLVIGGVLWGISYALRDATATAGQFAVGVTYWLGLINLLLGGFNLVPGFPLDGGRILRSLLWWRSGNLKSATRIASSIGRVVGFLLIFYGIYLFFTGEWFNGIWFALIGWFLESAAGGSYRQLLLQDLLKGHVASDIMSQDCLVVPPDITIDKLVNERFLSSGRRCYPVTEGNHVEGMVTLDNIRTVPREQWNARRVREIMTPLAKLKSVPPDEDLNSVLRILAQHDINQVPVVHEDQIVGMVSRDNLIAFINTKRELGGT